MGLRFQRRIKIAPGITLNVGKKGVSTSIGTRGAHVTVGKNGVRTTVGIPGTGISYTTLTKPSSVSAAPGLPYLKRCPYCGHGMRKRWDACPACHHALQQPLPPGMVRCPKCGLVYNQAPHFCNHCGQQMTTEPADAFPALTPDMEKYYDDHGCTACQNCHGPVPKSGNWRYCQNCGAVLPVSEFTFYGCMIYFVIALFFIGVIFF